MEVIVCRAHPVHISSQIKTTDLLENVRSEKNLQKVAIGKLSQHADIQILVGMTSIHGVQVMFNITQNKI